MRRIADYKNLGMVRQGQIGADKHPPRAVPLGVQPFGRRRSGNACGADQCPALDPLVSKGRALVITLRYRATETKLDPEPLQGSGSDGREFWRKARQQARSRFDQDDSGRRRIDPAKITRQGGFRQLGNGAGKFDPGRAAPDDHEGEALGALGHGRAVLRALKREQDPAPKRDRVVDCLQAGRNRFPMGVPGIPVRAPVATTS